MSGVMQLPFLVAVVMSVFVGALQLDPTSPGNQNTLLVAMAVLCGAMAFVLQKQKQLAAFFGPLTVFGTFASALYFLEGGYVTGLVAMAVSALVLLATFDFGLEARIERVGYSGWRYLALTLSLVAPAVSLVVLAETHDIGNGIIAAMVCGLAAVWVVSPPLWLRSRIGRA